MTGRHLNEADRSVLGIVIPAHNEERALLKCLESLAAQDYRGKVEVCVVANGCVDETADVARYFSTRLPDQWKLQLLEHGPAHKALALNMGDKALEAAIRVYLDADILLGPTALRKLAEALQTEEPRLVQPRIAAIAAHSAPRAVRSFVKVWSSLPYVRNQVLGVGCFAVNAQGRDRWKEFPLVGADDTYVRYRFEESQKEVVEGTRMEVFFPSSISELIRVRARWCRLGREVRRNEEALPPGETTRWLKALLYLALRPWRWLDALMFSMIWVCAVLLSYVPNRRRNWARAHSAKVRE